MAVTTMLRPVVVGTTMIGTTDIHHHTIPRANRRTLPIRTVTRRWPVAAAGTTTPTRRTLRITDVTHDRTTNTNGTTADITGTPLLLITTSTPITPMIRTVIITATKRDARRTKSRA